MMTDIYQIETCSKILKSYNIYNFISYFKWYILFWNLIFHLFHTISKIKIWTF